VKNVFGDPSALSNATTWRLALRNPSGGEITGAPAAYVFPTEQTVTLTTLIARGSTWKYLDDGSNQGTAWRAVNFPYNTWSNGVAQLGFGDFDEATPIRRTNSVTGTTITFYFRQAFSITNPATFADLSMWMLRDDGAVVYLNGTEVFRSPSMPPAPTSITYTTFADNQGAAPPDNSIDTATLSASLLIPGTNVVAAEIHQFNSTSSDASFDFSLIGNPQLEARLFATLFGNQLALHWNTSAYALEQANQVTSPWTFVARESPATISISTPQRFFRLRTLR
jgi:hypothetical protein